MTYNITIVWIKKTFMIFIGFLVFDDFGGAIPEKWSDLIFLVIFHV